MTKQNDTTEAETTPQLQRLFTLEPNMGDSEMQAMLIIDQLMSEMYGQYMDADACKRVLTYMLEKYGADE